MAFSDNPVLNRELLVNLRTSKSFLLLAVYQLVLASVVYFSWPQASEVIELAERNERNARLVDTLFLSQFVLTSLFAPSFAAGGITGEKERKTYEMLLASPIQPGSIVLGKLIASFSHLAILVFSSLPIIMLCLPMGGVSIYEVLVQMLVVLVSMTTFCMISLACSSLFMRTAASLSISYLLILILSAIALWGWHVLRFDGQSRLHYMLIGIPSIGIALSIPLFHVVAARMMYPPDVGSEGAQVVDLENEAKAAVGLVLNRDAFPDRLLLPPTRIDLMPDQANPVFDKEMRSEFIGQGTLMLRWVIQISVFLAIGMMILAITSPKSVGIYIAYVLLFNMLVAPVFSAGIVTSERERQTLDLLLTTPLTAGQIWLGKLLASLRVSSALTSFLIWPLLCAVVLRMSDFGRSAGTLVAYLVIIAMTCLSTCSIGLFCSTVFSRTSISITVSYGILLGIYTVLPGLLALSSQGVGGAASAGGLLASTSPYWVVFRLPLTLSDYSYTPPDSLLHLVTFVLVAILLNGLLAAGSIVNLAARSRLLRSS